MSARWWPVEEEFQGSNVWRVTEGRVGGMGGVEGGRWAEGKERIEGCSRGEASTRYGVVDAGSEKVEG